MTVTPELGRHGIWRGAAGLTPELAQAVESSGFGEEAVGIEPEIGVLRGALVCVGERVDGDLGGREFAGLQGGAQGLEWGDRSEQ